SSHQGQSPKTSSGGWPSSCRAIRKRALRLSTKPPHRRPPLSETPRTRCDIGAYEGGLPRRTTEATVRTRHLPSFVDRARVHRDEWHEGGRRSIGAYSS